MRIIGGKYKGRRVVPHGYFRARPTTDFAREGLFNILNNRIDFQSVNVLDLFAGTGSISYEFISRGALSVHLVESDIRHITGIKHIIRDLELENIMPYHLDVRRYLKTCTEKYDIVFADPPYNLSWLCEIPDLVTNAGILKTDGLFILEHPGKIDFKNHELYSEQRRYGKVHFSLFISSDRE